MRAVKIKSLISVGLLSATVIASGLVATGVGASAATVKAKAKVPNLKGVTLSIGDISEELLYPLLDSGLITPINNNGLYSVKGYAFDLQYTQFVAGPEVVAGIVGGSVDLGLTADTPAIFAEEQGVKFKTVAVGLPQKPGADFSLVVPKGSSITSVSQLSGKTISAQTGTINEYFAVKLLQSAGLSEKNVTVDNLTPTNAEAALSSGSVAAAILPEPYATLETLEGGKVIATGSGYVDGYGFLDASQAALNQPAKSLAIGDFLRLLGAAKIWTARNITVYTSEVAKAYGIPTVLVTPLIADNSSSFVPINETVIKATQNEANTFYNLGELTKTVQVKKIFDDRYNAIVEALNKIAS